MANPIAGHPYPNLQPHDGSGLMGFPWAEVESFDMSCGEEGVSLGMVMLLYWGDFTNPELNVLGQLLGYTARVDQTGGGGQLVRHLPWQHPRYNQLWVKQITSVKGIRMEGKGGSPIGVNDGGVGAGLGGGVTGPVMEFNLARITLKFWRPPYAIRTDADIIVNGVRQEWLRYTDRKWQISSQMLVREGSMLRYTPTYSPSSLPIASPMGRVVSHLKVSRKWYQIPEAAIFGTSSENIPSGIPRPFLYTQTQVVNPITGFIYPMADLTSDTAPPMPGCVNAPVGGVTSSDNDSTKRFFGCYMGTLRFESAEITPRPLHLPAWLLEIPVFGNNEAISQVQYDVTFNFDLFDPPRGYYGASPGTIVPFRGHNLAPWAGDELWYPCQSQKGVPGSVSGSGLKVRTLTVDDAGTILTIDTTPNDAGTGYPNNVVFLATLDYNEGGSSAVVSATTGGAGTVTSVALVSGGSYYAALSNEPVVNFGYPVTPFHYVDFSDLFKSL